MQLPFSTPGLVQRTPLVYPVLLTSKYSQIHWHKYKQSFSESQHFDKAQADSWTKREIRSAQRILHSSQI